MGEEDGRGGGREGEAADIEEGVEANFGVMFSVEDVVKAENKKGGKGRLGG